MKKPKPSPVEGRYQTYVAWCLSLEMRPAPFERWLKTLSEISEHGNASVLAGLSRTRGNGLLKYA
jgi:hypothetical protein